MPATDKRSTDATKSLKDGSDLARKIIALMERDGIVNEPCIPVALLMLTATSLAQTGVSPFHAVKMFAEFSEHGGQIVNRVMSQDFADMVINSLFKGPANFAEDLAGKKNARWDN